MDDAEASGRYFVADSTTVSRRVGGRGHCGDTVAARLSGAVSGADLGGSSKYSNGNFEG